MKKMHYTTAAVSVLTYYNQQESLASTTLDRALSNESIGDTNS